MDLRKGYNTQEADYSFDVSLYFALTYDACMKNTLGKNDFDLNYLRKIIEEEFIPYPIYKVHIYPEVSTKDYYQHKNLNIFIGIDKSMADFSYGSSEEINNYLFDCYSHCKIHKVKGDTEIYVLMSGQSGLYAHKTTFKAPQFDIQKHYNDDFVPKYEKIVELIDSNDTGLVLLHGVIGGGKTSVIRHLMTRDFNRRFVFIPSGYAEMLGEPGFNNLLIQSEYRGCVLVIEDAESLLEKTQKRSAGMSNLLNLTDGLMKDVFGCLVIATFNTELPNIDAALTRGGRLKCRYDFKKLAADKVFKLNQRNEPMSLSEIFCESEEIQTTNQIGFKMK